MSDGTTRGALPVGEFIALSALLVSLVALSIDAMLPALPAIGADLGTTRPNDNQLIVSTLFLGLAVGPLLFGPLSDSIGRKPAIYLGLAVFVVGCILSLLAANLAVMLVGRLLQGIGAAGPRIVTMALIRDQYAGRAMARIVSFVMGVFILVPALAPALGQIVLMVSHWRAIFAVFLVIALIASAWFALRQPETLSPERRVPLRFGRVLATVAEVCRTREALGPTVAAGLVFGAFVGYLSSAQQILQEGYELGAQFPIYFAVLALAIGTASVANARLVMHFGMRRLARIALLTIVGLSLCFLAVMIAGGSGPPLSGFMLYMLPTFFCVGILFGNLNALAMEPLGHIAGVGATVVGFLSTAIAALLGAGIGRAYDGSLLPLCIGFGVLALLAFATMLWVERNP